MNAGLFRYGAALAALFAVAGCAGHGAGAPLPVRPLVLPMPTSVSPALIKPAPMAKTALLPPSAMTALTPRVLKPLMAIRGLSWTQLPGAATQVLASPDGTLWALSTQPSGPDKYIWHYASGQWTNIPGLASELAVSSDGYHVYAINSGGGAYEYNGPGWYGLGGGARRITVAQDGSVYVLSNGGSGPDYAIWENKFGTWTQVPGAGVELAGSFDNGTYSEPIGTISPDGVYILNSAGSIYYLNSDGTYALLSGAASAIAPTNTGGLFVLAAPTNPNGNPIYYDDLQNPGWTAYGGAGTSLSVNDLKYTSQSNLYVVSGSGAIYTSPILSASPAVRTTLSINGAVGTIESVVSANGSLWWNDGISVGSSTPGGVQGATYTVPNNGGEDYNMVLGPDSNLWFTQSTYYSCSSCPDYATRVMLSGLPGAMNAFALPVPAGYTASSHSNPTAIAAGSDGNLWIAESVSANVQQIVKMTTAGAIAGTYTVLPNSNPGAADYLQSMASGPDGNMWFVLDDEGSGYDEIGKITPAGTITRYHLPNPWSFGLGSNAIVSGPDGNLWFTEYGGNRIGKISTSGAITEYALPSGANPQNMIVGPDGNLWLRCDCGAASGAGLVKVTTAGVASGPYLMDNLQVDTLVDGPDGNLWFGTGGAQMVQVAI